MQMGNGAYRSLEVRAEVWPVAADDTGIWLLSGDDAWRSGTIRQDTEPHRVVEDMLAENGLYTPEMCAALREWGREVGEPQVALMHSPSWRPDGEAMVCTYIAVIRCRGLVPDEWPQALPVSEQLLHTVGKPEPHTATGVPVPRYVDVLAHALRHLRFLQQTDSSARYAIDDRWREHLAPLAPALSGMYEHA